MQALGGPALRAKVGEGRGRKSITNPARLVTGNWSSGYGASPRQVPAASYFSQIRNNITSLRRRYGQKNPERAWSPFVSKATFVAATSQAAYVQAQGDKRGGSPLALTGMEEFGCCVVSLLRPHTIELQSLFPGAVKHPLGGPRLSSTHACPGAAQHPRHVHWKTHLAVITPLKRVSCAEPPAQDLSVGAWG